ncbi:hypothetical protein FRC16_007222 [Serendipita sp. 398]|nr:hypothetical protein FRC16_007222 [Serendipita sp. 398]
MCNSICTGFSCGGGLVSCAAGESCCGTTCPCGSSPPTTDPIDDPNNNPTNNPNNNPTNNPTNNPNNNPTNNPTTNPPTDPRTHLSKGEIAGISLGSVAAVAILAFCGFKCHKRLRARRIASRKKNQDNEETKTPDTFEKSS